MIESMERRVQREGLRNVRMVLGAPDDPKLPAATVDAVLIVDAYHEVESPIDLLRNVRSALKSNGRLGIVEFRKDGWGPGPPISTSGSTRPSSSRTRRRQVCVSCPARRSCPTSTC